MKFSLKKILLFLVTFTLLCTPALLVFALTSVDLTMPIPGLPSTITLCSKDVGGNLKCDGIAKYIVAFYEWLIAFTLILGVIALMVGGAIWILAGGSEKRVTQAQGVIKNSLVGLLIALFSYLGLWTISPNLVQLKPLMIFQVKKIELTLKQSEANPSDTGDTGGGSTYPGAYTFPGVYCPRPAGGDPKELPKIAESLKAKITYRMGGVGNPPPYPADTKKDASGVAYSTYCPSGQLCFDCSGFANFLLECAGMNSPTKGTANIFTTASEEIKSSDPTTFSVNGTPLQPGDLVGNPSTSDGNVGHVGVYIGDGIIVQTYGGKGRQPGHNASQGAFSRIIKEDWVTMVRRYSSLPSEKVKEEPPKVPKVVVSSIPIGEGTDSNEDAEPKQVCELPQTRNAVSRLNARSVLNVSGGRTAETNLSSTRCTLIQFAKLPNDFAYPGVRCPRAGKANSLAKVVDSFGGKVTYRLGGKGEIGPTANIYDYSEQRFQKCPEGTLCLDCSGFVNTALQCAGFDSPGSNTDDIYQKGSEVIKSIDYKQWKINGKELEPGDLVVYPWKGIPFKEGSTPGHIIIYVGWGNFVEARGGPGKELNNSLLSSLFNQTFVDRVATTEKKRGKKLHVIRMGGGLDTSNQFDEEPKLTK